MMGRSHHYAIVAISMVWGICDVVTGYGNGAPQTACVSMTPGHINTVAQTTPPPFEVTVLANTYRPGQNITVLLTAPCPGFTQFQGFLLEARRADVTLNRDEPLGEFNAPDQSKHVFLCGATGRQAVTHTNTQAKNLMNFSWTAPSQPVGHIVFVATFATEKSTYWVKVYSSVVRDEGELQDPNVGAEQYPTLSSCKIVPTEPPQPTIPKDGACGLWKSCMDDCTDFGCNYVVSWQNSSKEENTVFFELASVVDRSTNRWMAIGFSEDRQMGEDKVVECVAFNNAINVYTSFNTIYPRLDNERNTNPRPTDGVFKVNASLVDGIFRCSFRVVTAEFSYINLTVPWYLLFATGRTASFRDNKLQHEIDSLPPVSVNQILFVGEVFMSPKNDSKEMANSANTVLIYPVYIQCFIFASIALLNGAHLLISS